MKTFDVEILISQSRLLRIEAHDKHEAQQKALSGQGDLQETHDDSIEIVSIAEDDE